MSQLLRQYKEHECGEDGYPFAWHGGRVVRLNSLPSGDPPYRYAWQPEESLGIKYLIREQASYRCLRCGHPYPPGTAEAYPRGEWTPCDDGCSHGGPVRTWRPEDREYDFHDQKWIEYPEGWDLVPDLDPRAWMGYQGRQTFRMQAQWRILTVHHLDEDKANCRWWNLAALCQRCHLRMQRAVVMGRPYHYEHSEWFKPYAAGFYAFKYLGEDLTREETMSRLDELLALEHRFTQETLL